MTVKEKLKEEKDLEIARRKEEKEREVAYHQQWQKPKKVETYTTTQVDAQRQNSFYLLPRLPFGSPLQPTHSCESARTAMAPSSMAHP